MLPLDKKLKLGVRIICEQAPVSSEGAVEALRHLRDRTIKFLREAESAVIKRLPEPTRIRVATPAMLSRRLKRQLAAAAACKVYDDVIFDRLLWHGRPIGDVWYSELHEMRNEGLFWASVADQLLRHGTPAEPARVREMVNAERMTEIQENAKLVSGLAGPQQPSQAA